MSYNKSRQDSDGDVSASTTESKKRNQRISEPGDFPDLSQQMSKAWRNNMKDITTHLSKRVDELEMWHLGMGTIADKNPNLEFRFGDLEAKVKKLEAENDKLKAIICEKLGVSLDAENGGEEMEGGGGKRVKFV